MTATIDVLCWCGAEEVTITRDEWAKALTRSCGRRRCDRLHIARTGREPAKRTPTGRVNRDPTQRIPPEWKRYGA